MVFVSSNDLNIKITWAFSTMLFHNYILGGVRSRGVSLEIEYFSRM